MTEHWYRVTTHRCAAEWNDYDEPSRDRGTVYAYLQRLAVVKRTRKGVWVDDYGTRRFILTDAKKRYACPTIDEAVESHKARSKVRISLLHGQIADAEEGIEAARRQAVAWKKKYGEVSHDTTVGWEGCHAGRDGECNWEKCPQLKDGEPLKTGRHCPLDKQGEHDEKL